MFVLNVSSLPYSNADCERVFSKVNLIKTKTRNKLNNCTVSNILLSKQSVSEFEKCSEFSVSKDMFARHNVSLYKKDYDMEDTEIDRLEVIVNK